MIYPVCDNKRHLICIPYSIANLHKMAIAMNIAKCWFHKDHYDIPIQRIYGIMSNCIEVGRRDIVRIARHREVIVEQSIMLQIKKGLIVPKTSIDEN